MINRWKHLLTVVALAVFVAVFFWQAQNETPVPSPRTDRSMPASAAPRSPAPRSPFLKSHEEERATVPSSQNVDRSFHAEIEQLRESVRADSNSVDDMTRLARLSQDSHRLEEAITLYRRILKLEPENREAWLDLTGCYGLQEDWASALDAVARMLTHFEGDLGALYNQGAIFANMGNENEATRVWTQIAEQDEDERLKSMAVRSLNQLEQQ